MLKDYFNISIISIMMSKQIYFIVIVYDELDCQIKTSHFIGYVNKLIVNCGHLRGYMLNKLFKLYCCSFYAVKCGDLDLYISIKLVFRPAHGSAP